MPKRPTMYIRAKGRGKWQCVWNVKDPTTGRRRRVTEIVTGTKDQAIARWVERRAALLAAAHRPVPAAVTDWTVADLLQHWLTVVAPGTRLGPRTVHDYQALVAQHIAPVLGAIRLTALHPAAIQAAEHQWLTAGRRDGQGGLAPSTVRQLHHILQGALGEAVRWGWLPANPCAAVRPPRVPARAPAATWSDAEAAAWWAARRAGQAPPRPAALRLWTPDQIARFTRVAQTHRHGRLFLVVLRTGLRQAEILGLRWRDVDWDGAALHVTQQLLRVRGPDGARFGPLKTAASRRVVALDADTLTLLRQEHAAQAADRRAAGPAYRDHGLVFQTALGTPLGPRNVNRLLARLEAQAGVPPLRFHDLRHTHASLLIAGGADARLVAERLGHSSVAFTLQTYAHLWPGRQAEVLRALPSLQGPDRAPESRLR